jgi:hypothetical protein
MCSGDEIACMGGNSLLYFGYPIALVLHRMYNYKRC